MLQLILEIIGNVNLLLGSLAVVSAFAMLGYLKKNGLAPSRLVSFDPLIILEYPKHTKSTNGRIGIWFWIFICSSVLLLVSGITELVLSLVAGPKTL